MNNPDTGTLWAITSFFNPVGSRRRLANYRRFRDALQIPLATIELSFDHQWELSELDAELVVHAADGDVLWQKERLLNHLAKQLPAECKYVAWIDCDLLMKDSEWPRRAIEALTQVPLIQLFSTLRYLREDEGNLADTLQVNSVAAEVVAGRQPSDLIGPLTSGYPNMGMAWAARRELFEQHGLYDGCVIGGGDTALVCAAYGNPEDAMALQKMNMAQRDRYGNWAAGLYQDVKGEVGALSGEIHHMWHGELANRRYGERHSELAPHLFDPYTDIRIGTDGAWRWASNKPELHALLRNYFHNRKDDSAPLPISS